MPGLAAFSQREESRPTTVGASFTMAGAAPSTTRYDGDDEDEHQEAETFETTHWVRVVKRFHDRKVKDDSARPQLSSSQGAKYFYETGLFNTRFSGL